MTASVSSLDDPYVPLAFSMYSTPGAYAVLAGAGVSMGAGLPTAWDIVVDLAQQLCRPSDPDHADSLNASNVEDWYVTTYHKPLSYSGLLERVAPTQHEREAVLRRFFEPQPDPHDPSAPPKTGSPSAAHTATAKMMAAGFIRVIVTMNFDHLFEDALAAEGIVPTVVRTDLDADGLPPLHTIKHLVVHLHGDYRDATSMLNTGTELSGYQPHMQQLLTQIVANHGLLIAGWSAEHDHALRQIVRRSSRPYYTPAWINPSALNPAAAEVATAIKALTLHATADQAFARLADAVTAMRTRQARHPLTAAVVTDRIKRDLSGGSVAITAHDTFTAEAARLDTLPELGHNAGHSTDYEERVAKLDEACQVPAAAIAVLTRWGNTDTDEWWLPTLERWSHATHAFGEPKFTELPLLIGVRLFYAAGIGAVAGRRYDLLERLFTHQVHGSAWRHGRACGWFGWDWGHANSLRAVTNPMRDRLAAVLADALTLSPERIDTTWQEFETLRTAAQILSHPDFGVRMQNMATKQGAVSTAQLRVENEGTTGAQKSLRDATIDADRTLDELAQLAVVRAPHVWVEDMPGDNPGDDLRLRSPVALRLAERPDAFAELASLASPAVVARGGAVEIALRGAARAFEVRATKIRDFHVSISELWLDIPTGSTS